MMGNMQQQDIPGLSQLSPSGTQTATQASKRKRQLPFSLTQAAAVTCTAIDAPQTSPTKNPAAPHSSAAAAEAAANSDLAIVADGTMEPPPKRRRRPKVQPPPAGAAVTTDDRQAAAPSQPTAAADQQQSHLHVEQQLLQEVPATAKLHTPHVTRSSKGVAPASRGSKVQDVKVAELDASSWNWMLTAEQIVTVSDDELLQQCRCCLAAAADRLHQVQAADADRPQQLQSLPGEHLQQEKNDRAGKELATAASTAGAHIKLGTIGGQGRQELQLRQLPPNLLAQQQVEQNYKQQQPSVTTSFQGAAVPQVPQEAAASAAAVAEVVTSSEQQHPVQTTAAEVTLPLSAPSIGATAAGGGGGGAAAARAANALAPASHAAPRRGLASIRSRLLEED